SLANYGLIEGFQPTHSCTSQAPWATKSSLKPTVNARPVPLPCPACRGSGTAAASATAWSAARTPTIRRIPASAHTRAADRPSAAPRPSSRLWKNKRGARCVGARARGAAFDVIVHQAHGLHEGVHRRRADEGETTFFQIARQ